MTIMLKITNNFTGQYKLHACTASPNEVRPELLDITWTDPHGKHEIRFMKPPGSGFKLTTPIQDFELVEATHC